jgi:hypothetical protein
MWQELRRLQKRFIAPPLTTLTIMIAVTLFGIAPLRVAGAMEL